MVDPVEVLSNRFDESLGRAGNAIRGIGNGIPGFTAPPIPSASGVQVRQAEVPNNRAANATRNMVRFFLPETGIVEMYINPRDIQYIRKKHIPEPTRTRGGYLIQYWGEDLGKVSLKGTTGSSGVEGINVLDEVYRTEQVAMDPLALAIEAARDRAQATALVPGGDLLGALGNLAGSATDAIFDNVNNVIDNGNIQPVTPKPTLASIAFQVEMYWSGWVFRGYFTQMTVDERANNIGLFDYSIDFTVTQRRGQRNNFFPWHRSAVNGPSNSDPAFGVPYSFGNLKDPVPRRNLNQETLSNVLRRSASVDTSLQSFRAL